MWLMYLPLRLCGSWSKASVHERVKSQYDDFLYHLSENIMFDASAKMGTNSSESVESYGKMYYHPLSLEFLRDRSRERSSLQIVNP